MKNTLEKFDQIIQNSLDLFEKKMLDYGASWRILRTSSLTDQIFIKANRIRTIQEKKTQKVDEDIVGEFIAIINYSIMSLIQLEQGVVCKPDLDLTQARDSYLNKVKDARELLINKNHDYGEAWRDIRVSSITDLILQKLFRIKQIEDNQGKTLVSEGLEANYLDILNYAVFSIILLQE